MKEQYTVDELISNYPLTLVSGLRDVSWESNSRPMGQRTKYRRSSELKAGIRSNLRLFSMVPLLPNGASQRKHDLVYRYSAVTVHFP